jgi:hypothetical protein
VELPERLFVIAVVPEGGRNEDRMELYAVPNGSSQPVTPVFSSILLATTFLDAGQQNGHYVNLDYIFPTAGTRFAQDFPDYQPVLDPSPESFWKDLSSENG